MKTLIFSFLSILFLFNSCVEMPISKYYDYRLKMVNNSNLTICSAYSFAFSDTSLWNSSPKNSIEANHLIANKGETITLSRGGSWEVAFKDQIPSGKMMAYVFDNNVFNSVPWDTIKKNYMVLKRYDLTLQDLQSKNWTITYP